MTIGLNNIQIFTILDCLFQDHYHFPKASVPDLIPMEKNKPVRDPLLIYESLNAPIG